MTIKNPEFVDPGWQLPTYTYELKLPSDLKGEAAGFAARLCSFFRESDLGHIEYRFSDDGVLQERLSGESLGRIRSGEAELIAFAHPNRQIYYRLVEFLTKELGLTGLPSPLEYPNDSTELPERLIAEARRELWKRSDLPFLKEEGQFRVRERIGWLVPIWGAKEKNRECESMEEFLAKGKLIDEIDRKNTEAIWQWIFDNWQRVQEQIVRLDKKRY